MLSLVFALAAQAADGGDAGLYAPEPPPGSAFVRVINGSPTAVTPKIGGQAAASVSSGAASPYVVVPGGSVEVDAGGSRSSVAAPAGSFVTVAVGASGKAGLLAMTDTPSTNRAKAQVVLYNLSSKPGVDLQTADGTVVVLTDVPAGAEAGRELNGLTVTFAVQGPSAPIGTLAPVTLVRGQAYSVIVRENGGQLSASWVENRTSAPR